MANLSTFQIGDTVICHDVKGFHSGTMAAKVIPSPFEHRGARPGMVWVREIGLSSTGWVTEWPIAKMAKA